MNLTDLVIQYQKTNDPSIFDKILEHEEVQKSQKSQVAYLMGKYKIGKTDATSIFYEGITRSITKFDPSKGTQLTTYSIFWVKYIANNRANITYFNGLFKSYDKAHEHRKVCDYIDEFPNASYEEITKACGLKSELSARNLIRCAGMRLESSEYPDNCGSYEDVNETCFEKYEDLYNALEELSDDHLYTILQRFGLFDTDKMTLSEVGEMSGCTAENVRQRQNTALKHLRKKLDNDSK